jgi:hypothetical protein
MKVKTSSSTTTDSLSFTPPLHPDDLRCRSSPSPHAQVRQLHAAKVRAVQSENYEEAKRLKGAIEQLKQVTEKNQRQFFLNFFKPCHKRKIIVFNQAYIVQYSEPFFPSSPLRLSISFSFSSPLLLFVSFSFSSSLHLFASIFIPLLSSPSSPSLHQVGAQVAALEVQKQAAVAAEDYDRAKSIKDEIDRLRGVNQPPKPQSQVWGLGFLFDFAQTSQTIIKRTIIHGEQKLCFHTQKFKQNSGRVLGDTCYCFIFSKTIL